MKSHSLMSCKQPASIQLEQSTGSGRKPILTTATSAASIPNSTAKSPGLPQESRNTQPGQPSADLSSSRCHQRLAHTKSCRRCIQSIPTSAGISLAQRLGHWKGILRSSMHCLQRRTRRTSVESIRKTEKIRLQVCHAAQ